MRDVSNYQADVNVAELPEHIIAVKATEGTGYISPSFQKQWKAAKDAGKARIAYHFNHPSLSAVAQGRAFLNVVEEAGLEENDCLAADIEVNDGLHPEAVSDQAVQLRNWIEEETKCKLIIYTYLSFAESGNCAGLGEQPLWIADPSRPPANPRIPEPWKDWVFHQTGIVKGIDSDVFHSDNVEDLFKYSGLYKPPPLGEHERQVYLSDGEVERDTIVHVDNFIAGFEMRVGRALFRILH